ncbi:hypothetical protein Tsubulata_024228 [Turnera subulata]|uniref:FAS1 domain-containing protein n=1 Tax=Turnera subulata TaxID=218843 RepID=A0A9Q0J5Q9_9ROSI|nr:hypothetical protein Tsubulata_024228 [Turnera subulata]
MAAKISLLLLSILSLLSVSAAIPNETLLDMAETLSHSGYLSMSLTLQLVSNSVIPSSPFLTVFAPSDAAFADSVQPSLSLLRFHLSPFSFPLFSLKSFLPGSKIPTLLANLSLTVTSSGDDGISLNGVKITIPPVYDDGSLIVYGIEKFLDPGFDPSALSPRSGGGLGCSFNGSRGAGYYSFNEAGRALRSEGFSVMASFLDLQLPGFTERPTLTIFAPVDEAMKDYVGRFDEYASIFYKHVVPCRILWSELVNFDDGAVLETYQEGFGVTVSRSEDVLMLNEAIVSFPDMYRNDWLVVHGIRSLLGGPEKTQGVAGPSSEIGSSSEGKVSDGEDL